MERAQRHALGRGGVGDPLWPVVEAGLDERFIGLRKLGDADARLAVFGKDLGLAVRERAEVRGGKPDGPVFAVGHNRCAPFRFAVFLNIAPRRAHVKPAGEENKKIPRAGGPIAPASLTIPRGGGKIPLSHKRNPANCRGCIFIHPVKMQSPVPHSLRFADVCVTAIGDAFFGAQLRLRTFLLLEEGMSDDAESGLRRCGAAFAPCGFGLRRRGRAGCSACIRTSGRRCVCAGRDGRAAAL